MQENMKRYKYLDVARGIGLMLVIISHSCGLNKYLIYYYIPLFFVLSGYVYKEGRSYKENVIRKAKRLLLPYFGYSAVLFVLYALIGRRTIEEMKLSAFGILYSRFCLYDTTFAGDDNLYLFTIANGAMWYLTAFFVTGLIFHLVIDRCLADRKFLIGCIAVLLVITMALAELPILLPWSADFAFVAAVFMIAGTLLGRAGFYEKPWNIPMILATFVVYMGLCLINPGINSSIRVYGSYGRFSVPAYTIIGLTGSMLCIWVAKAVQNCLLGNLLAYIGQNTIILLAFHIFGLEVFEVLADKFFDTHAITGWQFALYHAVRVTVVVCCCLLLGMIDKRVKKAIKKA